MCEKMISNVICRLSTFADYSMLTYNNSDVINVMKEFDQYNFAPSQVSEVSIGGLLSQRMAFSGMNNHLSVIVNEQRIDITWISEKKQGFAAEEIPEINCQSIEIIDGLQKIFKNRAPVPYRLAWFTNFVYFELSDAQKREFRSKFLKELEFYKKEETLDDMLARYAIRKNQPINGKDDKVNILTTISRWETNLGTDWAVDGYNVELDINTWQNNKVNRFTIEDITDFTRIAKKYQDTIIEEIFNEHK